MFTKAALSRSRFALVLASAVVASVAGAWSASSAAAATSDSSPAVFAATSDVFYDGATIALLTRGLALRNGVLKARSALDAAADLTATTEATAYVEREVAWDITKDVDHQGRLDIAAGDTATFTYTLSVTHEIGPDRGWQVYGVIRVRNPNTFEVAGVEVSDAVDNGGTCTVDGNPTATVTVPAYNIPLDLSYSCTYPSAPSPSSGTSTATVSWPAIGSPNTSTDPPPSAGFDFAGVEPTIGNGSVDVMDPNNPDGSLVGSVTIDDPDPTPTFTYSVDYGDDPAGTCTDHPNTATITVDQRPLDHADATATVCVGEDLTVTKTAEPSRTRTYTWDISKDVDRTSQTIAQGGTATFDYTVEVTHDDGADAWKTTGTIQVSNPNDWEAITADVTDTVDNGGLCTVTGGANVSVPAKDHVDLLYTCTYPSAPSPQDGTNTATATWSQTSSATPTGSAPGSAEVKFSTVSPTVVDGSVSVSDPLDSGSPHTVSSTDPSSTTFTYHHDFSGDPPGTCTSHPNTATFTTNTTATTGSDSRTVEVCVAKAAANLTVTKTAHATYTRTYTWGITMSVDPASQNIAAGDTASVSYAAALTHDAGTDSDWQVTGTITVSNPNDSGEITLTGVEDAVPGGSCSITSGDPHATIDALGHVTLGYICHFTSDPGSGTNTATATWDEAAASTPDGTASGTADFTFGAPTTTVDGSVTVTDTLGGTLGTVSSTDTSPTTFTDHQHFSGDQAGTCTSHPNTATFTTNTTATTGADSSSATVCTGGDIAVAKTATTSFTRTYKWKITKSVAAPTTVTQAGGTTAAFAYTVNVTGDGYVDSAWAVSGKITLTNPNDWQAVAVSLADSLPGCTLEKTSVTVPKSGSADVGYTCRLPNGSAGTNKATATWDTTAFPTPHGSATGTAAFAFGAPATELGKTVTVTDTFNGSTGTLGTVTYPSPGAYSYSRTVTVPAANCVTYPNTATIAATGQTATASVTVCASTSAPSPLTGALTMGFWQNKNGQGIIAGANQANLLAFLKGYAPFSDASAPLTAYATTIIKAASASGSSMNAMLKAQMLATAFDVYFSDPARGGNKINAPSPIGGVRIDLTHVPPIGNTSAAFGGATSMTVSQTLAYAASQSNAGGSMWYGNVKSTQELAKDVFDAINNEWAVPV